MELRYEVRVPHPDDETPYERVPAVLDTWAEAKQHAEETTPSHLVAYVDLYHVKSIDVDDPEFGLVEIDDTEITEFYAEYFDGEWMIDNPQHGETA